MLHIVDAPRVPTAIGRGQRGKNGKSPSVASRAATKISIRSLATDQAEPTYLMRVKALEVSLAKGVLRILMSV